MLDGNAHKEQRVNSEQEETTARALLVLLPDIHQLNETVALLTRQFDAMARRYGVKG